MKKISLNTGLKSLLFVWLSGEDYWWLGIQKKIKIKCITKGDLQIYLTCSVENQVYPYKELS